MWSIWHVNSGQVILHIDMTTDEFQNAVNFVVERFVKKYCFSYGHWELSNGYIALFYLLIAGLCLGIFQTVTVMFSHIAIRLKHNCSKKVT